MVWDNIIVRINGIKELPKKIKEKYKERNTFKNLSRRIDECEIEISKALIKNFEKGGMEKEYVQEYFTMQQFHYKHMVNRINLLYQEGTFLLALNMGLLATSITLLITWHNMLEYSSRIDIRMIVTFLSGNIIGLLFVALVVLGSNPLDDFSRRFLYFSPISEGIDVIVRIIQRIERRTYIKSMILQLSKSALIITFVYIGFGVYAIYSGEVVTKLAVQQKLAIILYTALSFFILAIILLSRKIKKDLIDLLARRKKTLDIVSNIYKDLKEMLRKLKENEDSLLDKNIKS